MESDLQPRMSRMQVRVPTTATPPATICYRLIYIYHKFNTYFDLWTTYLAGYNPLSPFISQYFCGLKPHFPPLTAEAAPPTRPSISARPAMLWWGRSNYCFSVASVIISVVGDTGISKKWQSSQGEKGGNTLDLKIFINVPGKKIMTSWPLHTWKQNMISNSRRYTSFIWVAYRKRQQKTRKTPWVSFGKPSARWQGQAFHLLQL